LKSPEGRDLIANPEQGNSSVQGNKPQSGGRGASREAENGRQGGRKVQGMEKGRSPKESE